MIYLAKSLKYGHLLQWQHVKTCRPQALLSVWLKHGHDLRGIAQNATPNTNKSKIVTRKYNKEPPIDLKSVRVNQGTDYKQSDDTSVSSKSTKIVPLAMLIIPVLTFALGVWQILRRERKLELIDFLEKRTNSAPIELPSGPRELENLLKNHEYQPFKVKGYFLHSKEILLTMRHDLTSKTHLPGGFVITPFVLSRDPKLVVLVNRGFVPYTKFSPSSRSGSQIEEEIEIIGLLRSNEPENTFTPVNIPPNEWHYRDIKLMAECLGTAPIFLDAVASTQLKDGPIAGQTNIQLRNDHLMYLLTWFSLSILTSILWWRRYRNVIF